MKRNLKVDDDSVTIRVSKDFYSEDSIDEAIEIFQENFDVVKNRKKGVNEIKITSEFDVDFEKVGLEFFNFLLTNEKNSIKH